MTLHRFHDTRQFPISVEEAWDFFSDPRNLAVITPPDMAFTIAHDLPARMHPGLIVKYRVRPVLNVPMTWVTEITHVIEGELFVDEQRFGPYRFWHHQHHFRAIPGGVEMRDIVHYDVGFGPIGEVVNMLVVRRRIQAIFDFRQRVLEQRFGTLPAHAYE
ncbi:MAG: SRPBCC family protein [Chloroflexi bacterium]|nr:SRPBCC family protein [Chloroflexota bacterium]